MSAALLERPDGPADLLALLGWDLPPGVDDIGLAALDLSDLVSAVENLESTIDRRHHRAPRSTPPIVQVGVALASFLQGIDAVVTGFSATGDYLTKTELVAAVRAPAAGLLHRLGLADTASCCRSGC